MKLKRIYAILATSLLLSSSSWSLYFFLTRYLADSTTLVLKYSVAELVPLVTTPIVCYLGERLGYWVLGLLSVLQVFQLGLLITGIEYGYLFAIPASLGGVILFSTCFALCFYLSGGSGLTYAKVTVSYVLGYSIAGFIGGFLLELLSFRSFVVLITMLNLVASLLLIYVTKEVRLRYSACTTLHTVIALRGELTVVLVLGLAGSELLWSGYARILKYIVPNPKLYCLVYSGLPPLLLSIVRPAAGYFVDRYGSTYVLELTILSYLALTVVTALTWYSYPLVALLLWFVPLSTFFEVSSFTLLSRVYGTVNQAIAMSRYYYAYGIAGFIVLLALGVSSNIDDVLLVSAIIYGLAATVLYLSMRYWRYRY